MTWRAQAGAPLSPLQLKILMCAAKGLSNSQTAEQLHSSVEAIKDQRKRIYWQLSAKNITHAVAIGLRNGLILPEQVLRHDPETDRDSSSRTWDTPDIGRAHHVGACG